MKMLTSMKNAHEALALADQNVELLITGKRKPLIAKEINNAIGKATNVAKTVCMYNMWRGDKSVEIQWLEPPQKQIENK